jgi:large subunit ribosomal protein L14e
MTFTRFVEIGRVAHIAFGPDAGKLVTIVDVIDQNRALVDGPCTGVRRQSMSFKQLHLTPFVLNFPHSARAGVVKKAWEKAEIDKKWPETTWAKKIEAREKRKTLTDYDRYKLMKAKQMRNRIVTVEFGKLRKAAKKVTTAKKSRKPNKKVHRA